MAREWICQPYCPFSRTFGNVHWGNKDSTFAREETGQPRGPVPCQGSEYARSAPVGRVLVIDALFDALSGINGDVSAGSDCLLLAPAGARSTV
jgi:hypothetical protein